MRNSQEIHILDEHCTLLSPEITLSWTSLYNSGEILYHNRSELLKIKFRSSGQILCSDKYRSNFDQWSRKFALNLFWYEPHCTYANQYTQYNQYTLPVLYSFLLEVFPWFFPLLLRLTQPDKDVVLKGVFRY